MSRQSPVPRIVGINYRVRTLAFAWSFVVVGLILWERKAGMPAWGLAVLQFLAYPQLLWLLASRAQDPRAAELRNLYLDPLLLGAWIAALGFPTWPMYGAVFATALNNAVMRGWRGAGFSVVAFAIGALVSVAALGFVHYPGTSEVVTLLCFAGSAAYACSIGVVVWRQSDRLRGARDELRASEERYRLIAENAGDLIGMVDRDGRWRYTSPSYGRLLGAQDLHDGADAFRAVADEDQFRVRAAVQVVMQGGDTCRLRLRMHALGGNIVRLETLVHAVRDDKSDVTGAEERITAAYLREEQLEVAAHAFERMAEAIVITAADGRILTVNRAYTLITGFPAAEVVGQPEADFRCAMQPAEFYDELYAEVEKSGHWSGMTWSRRRDGTLYREWRSVSAVRDAEGRLTHFVALFRELDGNKAGHFAGVRSA
jgi:PAS domain S-box-containing protein